MGPTGATGSITAPAANDPPVISGTVGGQVTNDTTPVKPFATAVVSDVDANAQDALIILVSNSSGVPTDADGTLSGGGIVKTSTPGLYSIPAQSPASLTSALQSVVFTPTQEAVTGTSTVLTNFELIAVQQGADGSVVTTADYTTNLTVTQPLVILGPAGGFATIVGTSEPALIQAFGYVNTIYGNGGNDSITAGSGNDIVYTGGGSDNIILDGYANTVSGGDGSHGIYAVSADNGNDVILGGSGNSTVVLGNGNDIVEIGGGGNQVSVGNGNDTIYLTGYNNVVNAGSPTGTDTITLGTAGGGGGEQVTGGNGNFSVTVGGIDDIVMLGNGNNQVYALQGMSFITTGYGNDTITLGGSGSTVNAGGGINSIIGGTGGDTFVLPVASTGFDFISNFSVANGDILDLIPGLAATNWNGQANTLANYVQVANAGGNTVISISPTGSGASVGIAVLEGTGGNLTLDDLRPHLKT